MVDKERTNSVWTVVDKDQESKKEESSVVTLEKLRKRMENTPYEKSIATL
jgi:hypothetical protein